MTAAKPKHPRWIVIYYIHTPGSEWLGKGVEFFDEEELARKRGRETNGIDRKRGTCPKDRSRRQATGEEKRLK